MAKTPVLAEPGSEEAPPAPVASVTVDGEVVSFAGFEMDPDTAARSAEALATAAQDASNNRVQRIQSEQ